MHPAMFYEKLGDGKVQCTLCPQDCIIKPGTVGFCHERKNIGGELFSLNYGKISSHGLDPIEKKPLYHFCPGSWIFSVGTIGCNFRCRFCQNWQIAQCSDVPITCLTSEQLVKNAKHHRQNIGIAYTYSEPMIWFEYVYDTARLTREAGLKNVVVTNGFVREEPLKLLLPYIDAMNIDIKGFTSEFYRDITRGDLYPVLETVERAAKNCHVEVTTLLIPGLNDDDSDIEALTDWLSGINKQIPLHFSRYFPNYKMDRPPTPLATLEKASCIAKRKLDFVYIGNVPGEDNSTYCPECGRKLINRNEYPVSVTFENGVCPDCYYPVNVVSFGPEREN
jgi:pyruvate formate lyase activating enzyme